MIWYRYSERSAGAPAPAAAPPAVDDRASALEAELVAEREAHDMAVGMLRASLAEREDLAAMVEALESDLEALTAPAKPSEG
jgi:hypothetical protein